MGRCDCVNRIYVNVDLAPLTDLLSKINCALDSGMSNQSTELRIIRQSLTSQFPFVAKVEFPTVMDGNRIVYKLQGSNQAYGVNFRDYVLGPLNIYFSGKVNDMLPVYINDALGFELAVTAPGTPNDQLIGVPDNLVNMLLPASYEGNYIHLL